MSRLLTNPGWRWLSALFILIGACLGALVLSNAVAVPRRAPVVKIAVPNGVVRTPIYMGGNFTFGTPIKMPRDNAGIFFQAGGEPEIKIDLYGNIYIAAIQGVPGGTDLWKSVDNGTTFEYLGQPDGLQNQCAGTVPQCLALGGGDVSMDVSSGGYLYVSSLYLGDVTVSTSFDGGMGGIAPGQAWQVNPLGTTVSAADDRQWLAAYGPETVYMAYREAPGTGSLFVVKSTDAAQSFGAPVLVKLANSTQGNLIVDPYDGALYSTTIPSTAPNEIHLLKSTNGGASWAESTIYTGAAGTLAGLKFTTLAQDRGGNLHLVFSSGTGTIAAPVSPHVYLMSSADKGATWLEPVRVDNGAANISALMPWVVAGSPGVVDITWLGSTTTTPSSPAPPATPQPTWHLFFARTSNALAGSPAFEQVQISSTPVHDKVICMNGSGCPGSPPNGTRDLLEYYTITLDPEGKAHIAYVNSVDSCAPDVCITNTWYTKQTSGTSAYAPPAPPAPAVFGSNIPVGAPGAEPSIWVDSFNCVYVTAPGNPWVWKSVDGGASFLAPVNPVADEPTLTGGDEDVISLPKLGAGAGTRPDQLYFTDLGLSSCHIRKSTDGGANWFKPGPGGSAGDVSVSSDRQWLAGDQSIPAGGAQQAISQVIYHWEHELASEAMRFSSLVDDTQWVPTSGMTDPELSGTLPNTNPGPIFVNRTTHKVFALFNGSAVVNNAADPPFGKLLNVWEADADPPLNAASPVTNVQNHPVFKGTYDSPNNPPPAVGPPVGPNFGTNNANIFPAGDVDAAGNIYVAWSMNNSRTNEFSIWFASSHDNGQTYYGPFPVSSGSLTADETAVFPWVAAGDNGRVNIIWYGTNTVGDPNTLPGSAAWKLYFAQTHNGASREPVFRVVQPNPANIIHNGQISTGGLIGSSDRSLLDFMEVANGPDGFAHLIFADNGGQATRAEYTRQTSGPLVRATPLTVIPTCLESVGITPVSAVSRKRHGSGPTFDVNLPLTGNPGIECRRGGTTKAFQMVISFANAVQVNGTPKATLTAPKGGMIDTVTVNNQLVTVNLKGIENAQTITVKLNNVTVGANTGNVAVSMGVLAGDTNADRVVDNSDVSQTKAQSGKPVGAANFREDVTVDNFLDSSDVSLVKSKSGTGLTQQP